MKQINNQELVKKLAEYTKKEGIFDNVYFSYNNQPYVFKFGCFFSIN